MIAPNTPEGKRMIWQQDKLKPQPSWWKPQPTWNSINGFMIQMLRNGDYECWQGTTWLGISGLLGGAKNLCEMHAGQRDGGCV